RLVRRRHRARSTGKRRIRVRSVFLGGERGKNDGRAVLGAEKRAQPSRPRCGGAAPAVGGGVGYPPKSKCPPKVNVTVPCDASTNGSDGCGPPWSTSEPVVNEPNENMSSGDSVNIGLSRTSAPNSMRNSAPLRRIIVPVS